MLKNAFKYIRIFEQKYNFICIILNYYHLKKIQQNCLFLIKNHINDAGCIDLIFFLRLFYVVSE